MNQCKYIIKNKETENTDKGKLTVLENQQSQECFGENISNSQGDKFLRMESAFSTPMRQKKMKRVRSSFHLDEKCLKESKNKIFKLDPQKLIQKAYKEVSDYGSSTA
jgi:hypothetical protein